jgi:hypothetical protein
MGHRHDDPVGRKTTNIKGRCETLKSSGVPTTCAVRVPPVGSALNDQWPTVAAVEYPHCTTPDGPVIVTRFMD